MNYGESSGGDRRGADFESLRDVERNRETTPEVLQPELEAIRAETLGKMAGEAVKTYENDKNNEKTEIEQQNVELNNFVTNENELGKIVAEEAVRELVDDDVKNTETGSIEDIDGVDETTFREVERIKKIDNLAKRSNQAAILAKKFKIGRYADRSYMRGTETGSDDLIKELRGETGEGK